jgi:hypothetical protein
MVVASPNTPYVPMNSPKLSYDNLGSTSPGTAWELGFMGVASLFSAIIQIELAILDLEKKSKSSDGESNGLDFLMTRLKVAGAVSAIVKAVPTTILNEPHTPGGYDSFPVIFSGLMSIAMPTAGLIKCNEQINKGRSMIFVSIGLILLALREQAWANYPNTNKTTLAQNNPAFSYNNAARLASNLTIVLKPFIKSKPRVFAAETLSLTLTEIGLQIAAEAKP